MAAADVDQGPLVPDDFTWDPDSVDFSDLPETVWVKILSFLSYSTRCHVAQTCHPLLQTFDHPSLWERLEIVLSTLWDENYPAGYKYVEPERQTKHIKRFGKYVRTLVLVFVNHKITIDKQLKDVIDALGSFCRPEHVVLDVSMIKTKRDLFWDSTKLVDFSPIHDLLHKSDRLVSVTLRAWPMAKQGAIQAISRSGRAPKLKKVHLYWESASQATWASMSMELPDPGSTLQMLSPFVSLQSLALRSSMMSQELLEMLSSGDRARLRHLYILLTYSAVESEKHVPGISSDTWKKMTEFSPELRVEITVMTRMPTPLLVYALDDRVPLGGIEIMKYAKITPEIISVLIQRFSQTLTKFVCYADPDEEDKLDRHLIDMVTKCKEMNYFVYLGRIHCDTVVAISRLRGESWQKFQVLEDAIITGVQVEDDEDEEQWDEDEIIVHQFPDGSCKLARTREQRNEEVHWKQVAEAVQEVSNALGFCWLPLHSRMLELKLNATNIGVRGLTTRQFNVIPSKYPIAKGWPWYGNS